ncbi:hypothetical protein OG756_04625 [Streptomyces sp. NBC_01310]|uniref:hypothetical protein n=1 Tax=Streptomyces sp. NBC_01310 TaxID=2903820 RepID=UPI0035B62C84|nr:hypothetical protein OG756_04625 [Streptomyces sp. NBC_01310]
MTGSGSGSPDHEKVGGSLAGAFSCSSSHLRSSAQSIGPRSGWSTRYPLVLPGRAVSRHWAVYGRGVQRAGDLPGRALGLQPATLQHALRLEVPGEHRPQDGREPT